MALLLEYITTSQVKRTLLMHIISVLHYSFWTWVIEMGWLQNIIVLDWPVVPVVALINYWSSFVCFYLFFLGGMGCGWDESGVRRWQDDSISNLVLFQMIGFIWCCHHGNCRWLQRCTVSKRPRKKKPTLIKKNHFPFDQQPIETCRLPSDIIALLINLLQALLLYRAKPLQEC